MLREGSVRQHKHRPCEVARQGRVISGNILVNQPPEARGTGERKRGGGRGAVIRWFGKELTCLGKKLHEEEK